MILSNGVIVKAPDVRWAGSPATWGNWSSNLQLGNRWASYSAIYKAQTWVRILVDKRALLLARLPLKVYEHDDLNRPEVPDNAYAQLLARPNPRQSRFTFWQSLMTTFDIYGEAFALKVRDGGGRPYELWPMHPTAMHEVDQRDGRVIWEFDNGKQTITGIPDEDLFHPRNYNPDSYCRGLSKLESLRATLENEDAALRAQSSFWRNGARPGIALTHPGKLSPQAADRVKLSWQSIAGGADNFGRTVVLEEGMQPNVLSLSAEEAQYIEARRLNREEVIAAYDIPPPAVHDLTRATFSNITAQLRSIYRDTMAPITAFFESELETQLRGSTRPGVSGPDFSDDVYAEFLLDGVLRGDFEDRAEAYQKSINSGWQTPAEVRRLENLPFIEGSDKLFINSTMVPVGTDGDDDTADLDPRIIDAVGILVRSGFDPASILEALGLPPIEHLGLLPITLQSEEVFDADADAAQAGLDDTQARMLLGRLSRQKTLDEVDPKALVAGLNGDSGKVLEQLDAAIAGGEGVMGLRERIKHLTVSTRPTSLAEALKALAAREPVININTSGPRRLAIRRDESGMFVGAEEIE